QACYRAEIIFLFQHDNTPLRFFMLGFRTCVFLARAFAIHVSTNHRVHMRHFFIIAILALTITLPAITSSAHAQQTAQKPSGTRALPQHLEGYIQAQIKTDETYLAMVDAAIRNPAKTDWTKLRQIYPD